MLVGTTSIENSEMLSGHLAKANLPHEVLNAKQHAREAEIVAQAGRPKAVTIATNMAGRGTDIVLGGAIEPQILTLREDAAVEPTEKERAISKLRAEWQVRHDAVIAAGGLHIVGTERHESRRIDNQLRGRAGRQGDPGSSRFYLSLEDPLLRIFGGERLGLDHAAPQDARGRADRAPDRQPLDREGAEPRRVAQLRHPQAAARIRRRRQRPAPRDLPAAQRAARSRRTSRTRSAT